MSSSVNESPGGKILAGVVGWPVKHSRSPDVHGYWLGEYNIAGQYDRFEVAPDALAEFLLSLGDRGIAGVNVTLPHKEATFELMDQVDELAGKIAAVNTVTWRDNGILLGTNTDGFGFLENLRHGAPGWRPRKSLATVLGAGGAARAVTAALLSDGWDQVRISNRTRSRAEQIADMMGKSVSVIDWAERSQGLAEAELLVNTTSLGMTGSAALDIVLDDLPAKALVNDIVYVPLRTELLMAAEKRGLEIVDGLGMLLHQARPGFKTWFGVDPEVTAAQRKYVLDAKD